MKLSTTMKICSTFLWTISSALVKLVNSRELKRKEMARLVIKSEGFRNQVIDLKLGVNRLGRSPDNDFQIEHPTISARHCELELGDGEIVVRDCDSTNGTFVRGEPVREARLCAGQCFWLGDV